MRHILAAYFVPQLPRVVLFPLIAPGISARFDIPLLWITLIGLPVMLIGFAVLGAGVTWLRGILESTGEDT